MGFFWSVCLLTLGIGVLGIGLTMLRTDGWKLPTIGGLLVLVGVSGLWPLEGLRPFAVIVGIGAAGMALAGTNALKSLRHVWREGVILAMSAACLWSSTWSVLSGTGWHAMLLGVFVSLQLWFIGRLTLRVVR